MDTQPTGGFGSQPAATNPFGQPSQPSSAAANPFRPLGGASEPAPATQSPYPPDSQVQHPDLSTYTTRSMGRLTTWKGQPVTYREDVPGYMDVATRRWVRIWFPNGPPGYNPETEPEDKSAVEAARPLWEAFCKVGRFEGLVPEVPPLRIQCRWDV